METENEHVKKELRLNDQELQNLKEFDDERQRLALVHLNMFEQIDQIRMAIRNNETIRQRYIDGIEERYHIPAGKKWAIRPTGVIEIEGSGQ